MAASCRDQHKVFGNHAHVRHQYHFLRRGGKMKVPEWVDIVKLGKFNEMAPYDDDWYYIRAASVARHLYIRHPCGVGTFTKVYGGM